MTSHYSLRFNWKKYTMKNSRKFLLKFTSINPFRLDPGQREIINLNLYFHISLWCLERSKAFIKPFEAPKKSVKMKIKFVPGQNDVVFNEYTLKSTRVMRFICLQNVHAGAFIK